MPGAENPQSFNRFSYVNNNPVNFIDPGGHSFWNTLGNILNTISNIGSSAAIFMVGSAIGSGVSSALAGAGGGVSGAAGGAASGAFVSIASGSNQSPILGAVTGALSGGVAGYFGNTYSLTRVAADSVVGGINARIRGGSFVEGMGYSALLSGLTYGNYLMRQEAIASSRLNPDNIDGGSEGMFGDGTKLAGARRTINPDTGRCFFCDSYAGGCQGQPTSDMPGVRASLFGLDYESGSYHDRIAEAFAGPHDFLRNLAGAYDGNGNARYVAGFQSGMQDHLLNAGLLVPAAPFAGAALIPPSMYDALRVSRPW